MPYIKTPTGETAKIFNEKDTRQRLLTTAARLGCEHDVRAIMAKYDKAMAKATTATERHHIAACGAAEIYNYLGCDGGLTLDFKTIIPAKQ
jgi:hypothetical protein